MSDGLIRRYLSQNNSSKRSRRTISLLVALVWFIALAIVFWKIWESREILIPYLVNADYQKFIGVFIAYLCSLAAAIFGWSNIMHTLDNTISFRKNMEIFALTLIGRRLPGTVWYVGGRMLMYSQMGISNKTVILASSLEFIVTLVTGGLIGAGLLVTFRANLSSQFIAFIIIVVIIGILAIHPNTLKLVLKRNGNNLIERIRLKDVWVWLIAYSLMWVLSGLMLSQLVAAFNSIKLIENIKIIGIWAISGTAGLLTFFLPSSFGATEVTITALLAQTMPLALAGVIAILTRLLTIIFEMLLAAVFYPVFIKKFRGN